MSMVWGVCDRTR